VRLRIEEAAMLERGFFRRVEAYSVVALSGLLVALASSAAQACVRRGGSAMIWPPPQDATGPMLFQVEFRLLPKGEKRAVWVAPDKQGEILLGGDSCSGENVRLEPLGRVCMSG
jgi:hypothetical protein